MIHLARTTISSVANMGFDWNLLCFEKWGWTDGRMDDKCKNNDHYSARDCGSASWINNWRRQGRSSFWHYYITSLLSSSSSSHNSSQRFACHVCLFLLYRVPSFFYLRQSMRSCCCCYCFSLGNVQFLRSQKAT